MKRLALIVAVISSLCGSLYADSGRILNFGNLNEPEYIDPGLITGNVESNIVRNIFMGLTGYEPKTLEPLPELAEGWTISDDGLVYTFAIRKDAKWSNGTPVTAGDFVYSWERVLNPKTGALYAVMLFDVKNAPEYNSGKITDPNKLGLKAIDDKTFEVTLSQPVPYFLYITSHETSHAVPKWVVEKFGEKWTMPENIVTNGPFTLKSWVPQKEIVVMKSPTYWDANNVKLAGVRFFPTDDRKTVLKKYDSGEIDIAWELPPVQIPSLKNRSDFSKSPYLASYYYRVNTTRPFFKDPRVRQALSLAINRDVLVNQFLHETQFPWSSIVPDGMPGYTSSPGAEFNPEKAKKLLAEAGYSDISKFPKFDIHYNSDEKHKLVAQVIQQMWKQYLGLEVGMINEEWKSYLKTQSSLQYDVSRAGWVGDYPDPVTFLDMYRSNSAMNKTGWKNKQYDSLLDQAAKESNQEKRFELLREAEELILEESPIINIFYEAKMQLIKPDIKGYYPNIQDVHPYKYVHFDSGNATASTGPSPWSIVRTKTN